MKPLHRGQGPLDGSIGSRFGEVMVWHRRIWGQYYMFEYEWDAFCIRVYKNMYNPETWQDEWIMIHEFKNDIIHEWSKRPDANRQENGTEQV